MTTPNILDAASDYGSEFSPEDEQFLIELASSSRVLLETSTVLPTCKNTTDVTSLLSESPENSEGDVEAVGVPLLLEASGREPTTSDADGCPTKLLDQDDTDRLPLKRSHSAPDDVQAETQASTEDVALDSDNFVDDRSPLRRYRSFPRRPLTVTDLTAGAWCELQYWYTLTKLPGGRRTKTAAMKGGSKIHKKLEDEVHTTVQVDVLTREDAFALRLWNVVQGMRTLRETGLTRELEVWGVVQGNFVNGVIDALSYVNPNPNLEKEYAKTMPRREPKQMPLTNYFTVGGKMTKRGPSQKVYLVDVKTRGSLGRVTKPLLKPAELQLLLYHRFLSDIAAGKLDFLKLLRRYGLDADDTFTDGFIAQMGDVYDEIFDDSSSPVEKTVQTQGQQISKNTGPEGLLEERGLLRYQTLRELLELVKEEIAQTFPEGRDSIGPILRVQYVHRDDGREIDVHDFSVSDERLDAYLTQYMAWWQGERNAAGVDIEEAFKCRTCEFAADCSWRNDLAEKQMQKAHEKALARRMARESSASQTL